jgi:Spy/CpxP family protein refolding chaperone
MRNIRYTILISIVSFAIIAFSMTASAQQGNPPAGGAPQAGAQGAAPAGGGESRFDLINKAVTLTADQQAKVKAELQKTDEELSSLRKEFPTWNDAAKAAIDKMWARETERMLKVLNENQKPNYQAWIKAWLAERSKDNH